MAAKRKDHGNHLTTKMKKGKTENRDFSDDEDLSDIDDDVEIFNGIRIPAAMPAVVSAEDNPGPRMVIKLIVANNFKSYYGTVTIGPFHQSLSCIVGANGSGKSNVIDSLLFVFGYRSSKIRSKKVSVLLHKSDQHKDVQQCSVTVYFVHIQDDSTQEKGFVEIPGSEISIMRTAFKDNTSFYTLNNKRVKFKDVAIVLKKNGIDLIHNRFLILQGEVEQIAMMKPKAENEHSTGMLEYLEDVIGTVRYKKPIAQLEEKLNELSLEKNERISRLKAVNIERGELFEPAVEVVRLLKLENQLAKIDNKKIQKEIYEINKLIKAETEDQNSITEKLSSIETELKAIAESEKGKEQLVRELNEKLKLDVKNHNNLEDKSKKIIQEEKQLKANIVYTNAQIKKLENSIKLEQKKITKAKGVPKIKEVECEALKLQLAPLEEECIKLEANYTKINSNGFEKSKKFREEKDLLAPEVSKLQKLVASKQNQFQALKTEFEVLIDTEKTERGKLTVLEEQLSKGEDEFKENMRKKEKAETDICTTKDSIKELEKKVEKLKDDEQLIKTNLQNIRLSLTEKRTAYAETTERSRPIKYILSLKDKGEIRGVFGRCGDYGQVEGKFDVPASTACGSTDQIVVESTDAAYACINRLRTNNIGRLTFSIVPQIQSLKPRADANNNYPENVKRVFDLIKILDQRFRLTFYSGLYDTLLAENLDQARRIAYGKTTRYRVVTFKGEIIEQSGIISGGGRPIKGKIGPQETKASYAKGNTSQVSQNDVENLDKIAKDLEIKLRNKQSNIFDFEATIEQHHKHIEELNMIIRQCLLRINSWKEKENQVKNLIVAQKLVIVGKKTDPIAVAKKEAEIKKAEKEFEKANIEYDKIKSKMDGLKEKIEEITEGEPKEAKRLLDEATSKLEKTRSGINQVNVDIQAAKRQLINSEGEIEIMKKDIDNCKEKIKSYCKKNEENDVLLKELREQIAELNMIINEQMKNIEEIKNKKDESHQRSSVLRKEKITLSQKLENIEKEIAKYLDQRKQHKHALSKLKLQKIPEIDCIQRDPYMESHQPCGTSNKKSLEHSEKNAELQVIDSNQIEVDGSEEIKDVGSDDNDEVFIQYTDEELENLVAADIHCNRVMIKENIVDKNPNLKLLEEYQKRSKQYHEKADELSEVLKLYNKHCEMINVVRQRRRDEFMASFRKITIKLKEMYQMITLGGDAELELVDSLDPFSEGVNFSVRPPKKTWKIISNLSGGEKTLSSLALVFALHYYKPSPLYVMDEIDAALDFKNVSIIGHYIKERTKNSQFIIISLRSNMFEKANYLVGIYKTNDCTQTTYIDVSVYAKSLKEGLIKQKKQTKLNNA